MSSAKTHSPAISRYCGYHSSVGEFQSTTTDAIIGRLVTMIAGAGIESQRSSQVFAWREECEILRAQLADPRFADWHIALEYEVPRRWKRPDVVLLKDGIVFVIEFKLGAVEFEAAARWQVTNYALNLRDFHAESHGMVIVPILCATQACKPGSPTLSLRGDVTRVSDVFMVSAQDLGRLILAISESVSPSSPDARKDPINWLRSAYKPTPSIVEAAVSLYEHHSVHEISHSYADSLDSTSAMLMRAIDTAHRNGRRIICFVTGVPGAGKTLVGLNVVHDRKLRQEISRTGIFLSGNGPLIKVVRAALVQDQTARGRNRLQCEHEISTFIQNVHQFLRHYQEHSELAPHEHVVVFDEAQRAWDQRQMERKRGISKSEAALLLDVMERVPDWCVVIALIGGGQEIFVGEGGLEEWGRTVLHRGSMWDVIASPEALNGGSGVAGHRLFPVGITEAIPLTVESGAHLSVTLRSRRAERLSEWVDSVLSFDPIRAAANVPDPREFPIYIARDLSLARKWLLESASGQRCGLVATSEDQRLRAYGIESSSAFRLGYAFDKWFLAASDDCRSSHALEVAASEFECQGLELDWVGVCWGADLTPNATQSEWEHRKFRGTRWQSVRQPAERSYLLNRYRVLLTRAREGMVIWVPEGRNEDRTLDPTRLDRLFAFLTAAGAVELHIDSPL